MDEEPLSGGHASGLVVRVDGTVRKPWRPSSAAVQATLASLRSYGIDVPAPLGRDQDGRQVLEFVEGELADNLPTLGHLHLSRVGSLIRSIHDACAEIGPEITGAWEAEVLIPVDRPDLLCHNDLAPWNFIIGERWLFIDWDALGPSTRLWDLAYAAQSFANLNPGEPIQDAAGRLRAFIDGYDADDQLRQALPIALAQRTHAMYHMLESANRAGREPWAQMFDDQHGAHWRSASEFVSAHEDQWRDALLRKP